MGPSLVLAVRRRRRRLCRHVPGRCACCRHVLAWIAELMVMSPPLLYIPQVMVVRVVASYDRHVTASQPAMPV